MAWTDGDDDGSLSSRPEKLHDYRRSFLALGFAFLGVFLAPIPNPSVRWEALQSLRDHRTASIVVTGNSVVDHRSKCDGDRRTIPEMITAATGRPVRDMSYDGQGIDEALLYAALALNAQGDGPVVVLSSVFQFDSHFPFDVQTQLFFRLVAGSLHATSMFERVAAGRFLEPPVAARLQPYIYKGRAYPSYVGLTTTFFARERNLMRCPETLGHDQAFIEASYWNNYLRDGWNLAYVDDIMTLARRAAATKHRFLVVLLPVDDADVASLSPDLAAKLRQRSSEISHALQTAGAPLLDLTASQSADRFADRWCACGHLMDNGRQNVVSRVVAALAAER
jgi:hypothetical protein